MTFGENLRAIRMNTGISQTELAEALGVTQAAVSAWELGKKEPNFETCETIADYFNVPLSSVIVTRDPSTTDLAYLVADSLHNNPKLALLFDRARLLNDEDLDVVFSVVNAISKERDPD